jgi:hypothetical protein
MIFKFVKTIHLWSENICNSFLRFPKQNHFVKWEVQPSFFVRQQSSTNFKAFVYMSIPKTLTILSKWKNARNSKAMDKTTHKKINKIYNTSK